MLCTFRRIRYISFRSTHDLDIVLCVEAFSKEFSDKFKEYITLGQYEVHKRKLDSKKCFFRFAKPQLPGFPKMIELFSRRGDFIEDRYPTAAPLSISDSADSLSALLLNDDYYTFIMENRESLNELSVASTDCLIALKVRAWLDLSQRKMEGTAVDSKDIKKHKNDIFRLATILLPAPDKLVSVSSPIKKDISDFIAAMVDEKVEMQEISSSKESLLTVIARNFGLDSPQETMKNQSA